MKKITAVLLLLITMNCFSQFSKTHYIPPLSNSEAQVPQGQFLYISSPSITPVRFKIIELGGNVINGTVTRDTPYIHNIGFGQNTQLMISRTEVNSKKSNKGYIVEAEDLVYVNVRLTTTPNQFQAGGIVSKGLAALGKEFRIGAFLNKAIPQTDENHYTFVSVLATENNTTVNFSDIKTGVSLINNFIAGNAPQPVVLDRGQSFVMAVQGPSVANRDGLIGSLVKADKPIAVNCGSIAGTNGNLQNLDLGFDQIVPAEITGKEYIFVKGNGVDITERPLLVIHHPNTDVYINGSTTPFNPTPLQPGEYLAFDGSNFSANRSLYVKTTEDVFAYQSIGGTPEQKNQNMCFVPPLSCLTPKIIDNIPRINEVGQNTGFTGTVNVVTKTGATLNFIINGTSYTLTTLPAGITFVGPVNVIGNPDYETYTLVGLTGNVSVYSTKQLYLSYFGSSDAATYGGYYSGFTFDPEIAFNPIANGSGNCIPNVELSVNGLTTYDEFQWYFNGNPIPGATTRTYVPNSGAGGSGPGMYYVRAKILECGIERFSDTIPVSSCAVDTDNDSVNDNIDLDNDNDGITNCDESYGSVTVDLSSATGILTVQGYSNSFSTTITGNGVQTAQPFTGTNDGTFVSTTSAGMTNSVTTAITFAQNVNLRLDYATTATSENLLSANGEFILRVPVDKTLTVLNPDDQLLIDTNYDGIYESGITEYSSFEIRFRLNSGTVLAAGAGTFEFHSRLVNSLTYIHRNLSDDEGNNATFKLTAACINRDTDGDGIPDDMDFDSDNDGVPDVIEMRGQNYAPFILTDNNKDGLHDAFENLPPIDTDLDGVKDFVDLDSDNDGIYDLVEAQNGATDANNDGRIDGSLTDFGPNGLHDSLETSPESGVLNYTVAETDGVDLIQDYLDLDSDNDACLDVTEASFSDGDSDGKLGSAPVVVDTNGLVTSATDGYTVLTSNNYIISAPIAIVTQPQDQTECERSTVTFSITTNADSFKWQYSTDGIAYNDITDNAQYSGSTTTSLQVSNISFAMNGYYFRVLLNRVGNSCGLNSGGGKLTVKQRPVVAPNVTLKQCDDDIDGLSDFNLTQLENMISANSASEIFTYYSSFTSADSADANFEITNKTNYNNAAGNKVWVRVDSPSGCYDITEMDLVVVSTQIPPGFSRSFSLCDDFLDANGNNSVNNNKRDGISSFDLTSASNDINAFLGGSSNYTISYYENEADALAETNPIPNISNHRNINSPGQQIIWVRVDNNSDNSCYGLGPYVTLKVEALPFANPVTIPTQCDRDPKDLVVDYDFDTTNIQATILNGQTNVIVTYTDENGTLLSSPLPNPFPSETQTVTARVTNNATSDPNGACYEETLLRFVVDQKPYIANPVVIAPLCDDLPNDRDGTSSFDTTGIESQLVGTQTGYTVRYIAQDGSSLSSLPNPFVTSDQTITAIIENPLNPNCNASTAIVFTVNPLPDLDDKKIEENPICINLAQTVTLNAGLDSGSPTDYNYEWSRNNSVLTGETGYELDVTIDGSYAVKVSDKATGCFRIKTFTVFKSEKAIISGIDINDLLKNNTVNITTTGNGVYEYSIDNPNGPFQQSPLFENVEPGIHTVYVNDFYGCGSVSKVISVVGAPKFFTPNGDSYNDYWKILGVNPIFYPKSIVYIFDRYGKLLKEIPNGNDIGWDGTFNGQPMPGDDYWYVLHLDDGRIAKGHFALKR